MRAFPAGQENARQLFELMGSLEHDFWGEGLCLFDEVSHGGPVYVEHKQLENKKKKRGGLVRNDELFEGILLVKGYDNFRWVLEDVGPQRLQNYFRKIIIYHLNW